MSENTPAKAEIISNERGLLAPRNIDEAYRLATAYVKSGFLPARFTSPEMVLTAMQYALELGLKPLTALRQIAVVKGTPTAFGDLPLALCYQSGLIEYIREFNIDKEGKEISFEGKNLTAEVFGGVCLVKRKGDDHLTTGLFTLDDARIAKLYPSNSADSAWSKYTKIMLKYRARSQALKLKFPDVLNGIAIGEYDFNETLETITVDKPQKKTLDEVLNPIEETIDAP